MTLGQSPMLYDLFRHVHTAGKTFTMRLSTSCPMASATSFLPTCSPKGGSSCPAMKVRSQASSDAYDVPCYTSTTTVTFTTDLVFSFFFCNMWLPCGTAVGLLVVGGSWVLDEVGRVAQ